MKKEESSLPVIEWSGKQVTAYDPASRKYYSASSIGEVAPLISSKRVILALSRRSSFVRTVRVPDAPKEQVQQVLSIQLPGLLPISAADIAFDFRLTKAMNEDGRLAVVGAVSTETLRQVHKDLREAGLQAAAVVPVALGSGLLAHSLSLEACAVTEKSAEGLAIDIISEGELRYSRTVPVPKQSEGIAEEVCRTFNVAHISCSTNVAAGGLNFEGADTLVAARPLEALSAGLISKLDVNIEMPEAVELRRKKAQNAKASTVLFLWLGAIVTGAVVYLTRTDDAAAIVTANARYSNSKKQLNAALSRSKLELADQSTLQGALATAFTPAQSPSDVITEFGNKMPSAKMWTSGFTYERGKPLLLRGTALDSDSVAAYVQSLAVDPRFRDVKLVFANNGMIENHPIVEFSLQVHVMGNLPLADPFKSSGVKHS
jgi:hypothetical protein